MANVGVSTDKRRTKLVAVLQGVTVLCALPGGTLMLKNEEIVPGVLLLVAGVLTVISLVGRVIFPKQ